MNAKNTLFNRYFTLFRQANKYTTDKSLEYTPVIGLEIHAQIASISKLFSGACTQFGSAVNKKVALFDAAIPGTLPVLNRRCVEAGVKTALALSCKVNAVSMFDRKHYFYADLPAGYQITQQRSPLAVDGMLEFQVYTPGKHKEPYKKYSRIKQLQLEQDSGKSLHDIEEKRSLVDLNRAGIPLMELVFEPDLSDGEEAAALVKELSLILTCLKTCSCKMEEGALRVDANVSIHRPDEPLGNRTEIKNIGSVRGVAAAIGFEINRQIDLVRHGLPIINETRAWDAINKVTVPMRDKEEKTDYRFMPEPNLPPLHLQMPGSPTYLRGLVDVEALLKEIPELPNDTRMKLMNVHHISAAQAIILVNENILLNHFESIMKTNNKRDANTVANILIIELLTIIHKNKLQIDECKISSVYIAEIVDLLQSNTINLVTVRKVFQELIGGSLKSPTEIIRENSWTQIVNETEIRDLCRECLQRNPKLVKQFKSGKTKVFSALIGDVAKTTQQRASMATVVKVMNELLRKDSA